MARVVAAFLLAPLIPSLLFGILVGVAYLVMLTISLLIALPLFVFLSRYRRLEWWHATLAGSFCGLCIVALQIYDIDNLLSKNYLLYVGLGLVTGFLFWWIGIFRNPKFEFVSRAVPLSSLLIVPVLGLGVLVHQHLEYEFYEGRVLSVADVNPYPIPSENCLASVRLSNGREVQADFWGCDWPRDEVIDKCFHLNKRWSTLRFRFVYQISSGFGGGVDDC